ncbi:hypothetical protein MNV49_002089 [Pseudohyphozyma bogoriensis]|nr:hypothetical protein MNV49_002089 [Pseudohyphozyma bogoriensis]
MGKDRWQAGVLLNTGAGGSAMLVTNIENRTFLELEVPLVSGTGAREQAESGGKKGKSEGGGGIGEGVYEVVLPEVIGEQGALLPTWLMPENEQEAAGVSVVYTLEFLGTRKGMFKSNDKLSLNVPISFPVPTQPELLLESWPSTTASKGLKYKSDSTPLTVEATLSHRPLSTSSEPLSFHLLLTPSSPSTAPLLSPSSFTVSASASRKIRTTPIVDPSSGKEFAWAGVRLGLRDKPVVEVVEAGKGELRWEGRLTFPGAQRTVEWSSFSVKYYLTLNITSPNLDGNLVVATEVFVPSAETSIDGVSEEVGGDAPPPAYGA